MKCIEDKWAIRLRQPNGEYEVEGCWTYGQVYCQCDAALDLDADVEEWEPSTGRITAWGPGQAVCEACGLLYVDMWDGCRVYKLRGSA